MKAVSEKFETAFTLEKKKEKPLVTQVLRYCGFWA